MTFWHEMKSRLNASLFSSVGLLYLCCGYDSMLLAAASSTDLKIMLEVYLTARSKINSGRVFPDSP